MDSASTDGSAELARELGARVEVIAVEEFNHGGTRNRGAELARRRDPGVHQPGRLPARRALAREADRRRSPTRASPASTAARSRTRTPARPRSTSSTSSTGRSPASSRPPARSSSRWTRRCSPTSPRRSRSGSGSDSGSPTDIVMTEDQEWAARVLLAGYKLVYEPARGRPPLPPVHDRSRPSGASSTPAPRPSAPSCRATRSRRRSSAASPCATAGASSAGCGEPGQRRWIPYTAVYELAKFVGLQLGARHRRLPLALKRRLSAQPSYWEREQPQLKA